MFPFAGILSFIYKAGLYLWEKKRKNKLVLPNSFVISVGNITVGGTGKTSFVIFLSQFLTKNYKDKNIVVLSRGYKASYENKMILVDKLDNLSAKDIGDEPYLIAEKLRREKNFYVVVGKNRCRSAIFAVDKLKEVIFLLDDGFQYPYLARNLDIVLLDSIYPFSNYRLIPAGYLRQPPNRISKADIIIMTHCNQATKKNFSYSLEEIKKYNKKAPIFRGFHRVISLTPIFSESSYVNLSICNKKKILVFATIGNFSYFLFTLKAYLKEKNTQHEFIPLRFRDHKFYTKFDINLIENRLKYVDFAITTEKDEVKLKNLSFKDTLKDRILVLRTSFSFYSEEEEEEFKEIITKTIKFS